MSGCSLLAISTSVWTRLSFIFHSEVSSAVLSGEHIKHNYTDYNFGIVFFLTPRKSVIYLTAFPCKIIVYVVLIMA